LGESVEWIEGDHSSGDHFEKATVVVVLVGKVGVRLAAWLEAMISADTAVSTGQGMFRGLEL